MVAGNTYLVTCEVAGSRPEPTVTWWLGSSQLGGVGYPTPVEKKMADDIVKYELYLIPEMEDHGKNLVCRADNTEVADSGIEDSVTLSVYCE